ncbi:ComF family protein [Novosphingobium flavum]|uniref:ComF family protein n=1 Tax=Novosphingobium flavum TaxID=1778672 RepID=A0A7X1FPU0_9SPHN|nr:ComF family protein [Novosphingobium flavum]MBC2664730.1 ComF family protein [Novosphingobium flavum]
MRIHPAIAPLIDLVFPPRCPLCSEAIAVQEGICAACWSELSIPGHPCCAACQRPFTDPVDDNSLCAVCLAEPPRHDGIAAATLYNEPSRRLVLAFKRGGNIALAPWLARLIEARLPPVGADWLAVPVPLHRWRLWSRGYNQSALLAGEIARDLGMSMLVDGLLRVKQTPSLGGLGARQREQALKGAIAINARHAERLKGAKIVLVDDVLTSGATSEACVRALKRAGADKVVIACFARVLNESLPG